jgi:hypothetical protein
MRRIDMQTKTPTQVRRISFSAGVKSISDDDLCSDCSKCNYQPGALSRCAASWPGQEDADGYVEHCGDFAPRSE